MPPQFFPKVMIFALLGHGQNYGYTSTSIPPSTPLSYLSLLSPLFSALYVMEKNNNNKITTTTTTTKVR